MLSLYHTHESAPRNSYSACQFLVRKERVGLEQKNKSPRKKNGGRRASIVYVVGTFGNISFFLWAVQHRWRC